MKHLFVLLFCLAFGLVSNGQNLVIDGYTFETGNRGYLSQVDLKIMDDESGQVLESLRSDNDGHFVVELPPVKSVTIVASKEMFKTLKKVVINSGEKQFVKIEMERAPGYLFEITLADKRDSVDQVVDALIGTQIEVYNNTTREEVMVLEDHPTPEFKVNLKKGNHYTILVRKRGYLAKQMEAYVNVRGCILCFEGISDVRPGVSDNLTARNQYGTLLANVEMDKLYSGKSFDVENLYYDLNSAKLKPESTTELDKVVNVMKYNPNLTLELGSHTDSQGKDEYNQKLSESRAESAVEYIKEKGGIIGNRIYSVGYGERYLRNECSDGVRCSDAEHAINRRTEIKVVGIEDVWIFKPLKNIKTQEQFEAQLNKEIADTRAKEEAAAANKKNYKDIEGEKYYKPEEKSEEVKEEETKVIKVVDEKEMVVSEDVKQQVEVETEVEIEQVKEKATDIREDVGTIADKITDIVEEPVMVKDSVWSQDSFYIKDSKHIGSTPMNTVGRSGSKDQFIPSKGAEISNPVVQSGSDARDALIEKRDDMVDSKSESEVKETKSMESDNLMPVSDGFKIVIHLGDHLLSNDHKVHSKHKDLEIFKSSQGFYYYLLPGFDTKGAAQTAIETQYRALYPTAYVARFLRGKKI